MSAPRSVRPWQILSGAAFSEPMRVETVEANGQDTWSVGLVGTRSERFRGVTLIASDLEQLTVVEPQLSFDGDGRICGLVFRLTHSACL